MFLKEKLFGSIIFSEVDLPSKLKNRSYDEEIDIKSMKKFLEFRKKLEESKQKPKRFLIIIRNKIFYDLIDDLEDLFEIQTLDLRSYYSAEIGYTLPIELDNTAINNLRIEKFLEELKEKVNKKELCRDADIYQFILTKHLGTILDDDKFDYFLNSLEKLMSLDKRELFDSVFKILKGYTINNLLNLFSADENLIAKLILKNVDSSEKIRAIFNKLSFLFLINNLTDTDQKEFLSLNLNEKYYFSFEDISINDLLGVVKRREEFIKSYLKRNLETYEIINNIYKKNDNKLSLPRQIEGFYKETNIDKQYKKLLTIIDESFIFNLEVFKNIFSAIAYYALVSYRKKMYNNKTHAILKKNLREKAHFLSSLNGVYKLEVKNEIKNLEKLKEFINLLIEATEKRPVNINEWLVHYDKVLIPLRKLFDIIFNKIDPLHLINEMGSKFITIIKNDFQIIYKKNQEYFEKVILEQYPNYYKNNFNNTNANTPNQIYNELKKGSKVIYLAFDGLPYFSWKELKPIFEKKRLKFEVERPILTMIPSITQISRRAMFAGLPPRELFENARNHLNFDLRKEEEMLKNYIEKKLKKEIKILYISDLSLERFGKILKLDKADLPDVIVILIKLIDKIQHGLRKNDAHIIRKAFTKILEEPLINVIKLVEKHRLTIISTSDHGAAICEEVSSFPNLREIYEKDKIESIGSARHCFVLVKRPMSISEKEYLLKELEESCMKSNDIFIPSNNFEDYGIPEFWENKEILCCIIAREFTRFNWSKDNLVHGGLSFDEIIVNNSIIKKIDNIQVQDITFNYDKNEPIYSNEESDITLIISNENKYSAYDFQAIINEEFEINFDEIKPNEVKRELIRIKTERGAKKYILTIKAKYNIMGIEKETIFKKTLNVKKGKSETVNIERPTGDILTEMLKDMKDR